MSVLDLVVNGVVYGSIIVLGSVGLSLIYSIGGFANFAHGDTMTVGAYAALVASWGIAALGLSVLEGTVLGIPYFFFPALLAGMATAAAVAVVTEELVYKPTAVGPIGFLIMSIGLAFVYRGVIQLGFGADTRHYEIEALRPIDALLAYDIRMTHHDVAIVASTAVLVVVVHVLLQHTDLGRMMRAMADNPSLAKASGIRTRRVLVVTWILGAGLAGAAGVFLGLFNQLAPRMGFNVLLVIFAAVILGGIGSVYGAMLGGLLIGIVVQVTPLWERVGVPIGFEYAEAMAFFVMVLVLLVRPTGIMGEVVKGGAAGTVDARPSRIAGGLRTGWARLRAGGGRLRAGYRDHLSGRLPAAARTGGGRLAGAGRARWARGRRWLRLTWELPAWAPPRLRAWWAAQTMTERRVTGFLALTVVGVLLAVITGWRTPTYLMFLLGLGAMFALLSLGLNVQWGFTGLINFSVAAFFGLGAYGAALMTASNSPLAGDMSPLLGLVLGLVLAAVVAVLIAIPTLRLRADYLAIATLGLAEVVRTIARAERQWTGGTIGLRGIPRFYEGWPLIEAFPEAMPTARFPALLPGETITFGAPFWRQSLNVALVLTFLLAAVVLVRRVQRSPWGRVLRTIRADEDLAMTLGKNTFSFKLQAFVLGSLVMALGGVFFAHLQLFVGPGTMRPDWTFLVWVAVILGGTGSVRGAVLGGFVVATLREGTRFLPDLWDWLPFITPELNPGAVRLFVIGLLIVLIVRFRPQGILPPERELIWAGALDDDAPARPTRAVRDARGEGRL